MIQIGISRKLTKEIEFLIGLEPLHINIYGHYISADLAQRFSADIWSHDYQSYACSTPSYCKFFLRLHKAHGVHADWFGLIPVLVRANEKFVRTVRVVSECLSPNARTPHGLCADSARTVTQEPKPSWPPGSPHGPVWTPHGPVRTPCGLHAESALFRAD